MHMFKRDIFLSYLEMKPDNCRIKETRVFDMKPNCRYGAAESFIFLRLVGINDYSCSQMHVLLIYLLHLFVSIFEIKNISTCTQ